MALIGTQYSQELLIQAAMADYLATLVWMKTKDGQKGRRRPKSILQAITKEEKSDVVVYSSPEAFDEAREKLMKKGGD